MKKKFSLSINCSQMKKFNKLMIFKVTFCILFNNIPFFSLNWHHCIFRVHLSPPPLDLRVQMLVPAGKWKSQCFNFMHCVRLIFLNQFSLDVFIPYLFVFQSICALFVCLGGKWKKGKAWTKRSFGSIVFNFL